VWQQGQDPTERDNPTKGPGLRVATGTDTRSCPRHGDHRDLPPEARTVSLEQGSPRRPRGRRGRPPRVRAGGPCTGGDREIPREATIKRRPGRFAFGGAQPMLPAGGRRYFEAPALGKLPSRARSQNAASVRSARPSRKRRGIDGGRAPPSTSVTRRRSSDSGRTDHVLARGRRAWPSEDACDDQPFDECQQGQGWAKHTRSVVAGVQTSAGRS